MFDVAVVSKSRRADEVVELRLRAPDGGPLPRWSPGAHVDVRFARDLVRQYSLCGDPADATEYRIAVRREADGRGGSRTLHDDVAEGDLLGVSEPRNNFPLLHAKEYLFVAGGIGITPFMPMIAEARRRGIPFTLLYRGRTRSSMAFVDELEAYGPDVQLVPKDECGSLDIAGTLDRLPTGALVYCCGPERLVSALEAVCAEAGRGTALRVERFSARPLPETAVNEFDVELAASGRRLSVPHDRTLLEVLRDADVDIPTSCEEGTCGSCESEVLCGRPDHRDSVLTDEEREQGDRMMVCVSRSRSPLLILNL